MVMVITFKFSCKETYSFGIGYSENSDSIGVNYTAALCGHVVADESHAVEGGIFNGLYRFNKRRDKRSAGFKSSGIGSKSTWFVSFCYCSICRLCIIFALFWIASRSMKMKEYEKSMR